MDVSATLICPNCELLIITKPTPLGKPGRVHCLHCGAGYELEVREVVAPAERKRLATGGGYKR